jgi:predicted MFS family arabinose efflux permease
LPIVSILLVPAIKSCEKDFSQKKYKSDVVDVKGSIDYRRLIKYMLYYLLITYLVMVVSINLPFLLGKYGYDSAVSGVVTSIFFIAMMLPGLFINRIIEVLRGGVLIVSLVLIALGLFDVYFNSSLLFIILGCIATGVGYGIAQPYIYDVTASLASPQKATSALALLMTMNYVAILISPFLVEWAQDILGVKGERFPFVLNGVVGGVAIVFLLLRRVWLKRN